MKTGGTPTQGGRSERRGISVGLAIMVLMAACSAPSMGIPPELAAMPESKYIDINSLRIHYYDFNPGSGGKTIVHVHGFGGAGAEIMPLARLMPGTRFLALDLPGSGFSDRPEVSLTIPYLATSLDGFITAMSLGEYTLSAHSMGAIVALAFLEGFEPAGVRDLILFAPDGMEGEEGAFMVAISKSEGLVDAGLGLNSPSIYDAVLDINVFHDSRTLPADLRAILRAGNFYEGGVRAMKNLTLNAIGTYPVEGLLPGLDLDVLLFWGRDDRVLRFSWSEKFLAGLRSVEFHALDGCGHVPHVEKVAEVAPLVARFIGRK